MFHLSLIAKITRFDRGLKSHQVLSCERVGILTSFGSSGTAAIAPGKFGATVRMFYLMSTVTSAIYTPKVLKYHFYLQYILCEYVICLHQANNFQTPRNKAPLAACALLLPVAIDWSIWILERWGRKHSIHNNFGSEQCNNFNNSCYTCNYRYCRYPSL